MFAYVVECNKIPIPKQGLQGLPNIKINNPSITHSNMTDATTLIFEIEQGICINVRVMVP
jgi:hypothetical protein